MDTVTMDTAILASCASWSGAGLIFAIALNLGVAAISGKRLLHDSRQSKAEKVRAGLMVGEPCAYCGQTGEPVELDWRASWREHRYVCQDAERCVSRGRAGAT